VYSVYSVVQIAAVESVPLHRDHGPAESGAGAGRIGQSGPADVPLLITRFAGEFTPQTPTMATDPGFTDGYALFPG
jgi:hypothetical protein